MKKSIVMRLAVTVLFLSGFGFARAQSDELNVQGQTGGLYLEHTVVAKETWYSVGRLFNVEPKTLAHFNHLTFSNPLVIGQELKVPLTAVNFSQDGKKTAGEALIPVVHIVQEKEWLYRISVNHNKVPIPVLEKWNHVTGDDVHAGLHMIVGYLKVRTSLSALARGEVTATGAGSTGAGGSGLGGTGKGGTGAGGTGKESTGAGEDRTLTVPKAVMPPAGAAKVVTPPAAGGVADAERNKPDSAVAPAPEVMHKTTGEPAATSAASLPSPALNFNGGKFRSEYSDGGKTATGQAGIFKSTSGWQDGKYYALINNVAVGTIVKITVQTTGKSVYAKVLGSLPDMKESAGLMVRLSNAAAAELGEANGRFSVGVNY